MAARLVDKLPAGDEWLYELKWDGYRALLIQDGSEVELRSRNDKALTRVYPSIAEAGRQLKVQQAVLDGEIVALDAAGRPSFQALQHRSATSKHTIVFYAFDVLHLDGASLIDEPLTTRRTMVAKIIGKDSAAARLSHDLPGSADEIVKARVAAKRKDSPYRPGKRSSDWLKLKLERQQESVIGGYRPDGGSFDALLVGYHKGKFLQFAGKVRAGMVPYVRSEVLAKLTPLRTDKCPFADLPDVTAGRWGGGITSEDMRAMQWTKPQVVAQMKFVAWAADHRLRHAVFLGLRKISRRGRWSAISRLEGVRSVDQNAWRRL